jgi:hypothetical protein
VDQELAAYDLIQSWSAVNVTALSQKEKKKQ